MINLFEIARSKVNHEASSQLNLAFGHSAGQGTLSAPQASLCQLFCRLWRLKLCCSLLPLLGSMVDESCHSRLLVGLASVAHLEALVVCGMRGDKFGKLGHGQALLWAPHICVHHGFAHELLGVEPDFGVVESLVDAEDLLRLLILSHRLVVAGLWEHVAYLQLWGVPHWGTRGDPGVNLTEGFPTFFERVLDILIDDKVDWTMVYQTVPVRIAILFKINHETLTQVVLRSDHLASLYACLSLD